VASPVACVPLVPLAVDRERGLRPPTWAAGNQPGSRFWYFANAFGEPWVARKEGDALLVSGAEVAWRELRLEAAQADICLQELLAVGPEGSLDLGEGFHLAYEEALWLASVLSAAFGQRPLVGRTSGGEAPPDRGWSSWGRRTAVVRWP
jgi:hypothetical protein